MTMAENARDSGQERLERLNTHFNKTVRNTRGVLLAERAWPCVAPLLCVGGAFLSASWLGVWDVLPHQARMAGVLALGALAVGAPLWVGLRGKSWLVNKEDAYDRLDRNMGETEKSPSRKVSDTLHDSNTNTSKGLFRIHLERMWQDYEGRFKAGKPDINWKGLNGTGVVIAAIMAISSALYAGDNHLDKLSHAFNWQAPVPPLQVTASVTPPRGLGLNPIYLTGEGVNYDEVIAHKQSILTIHVFDRPSVVSVNGADIAVTKTTQSNGQTIYTHEITLTDGVLDIRVANGPQWRFNVNADHAPSADIRSVTPIEDRPSSLSLQYSVSDDYGVQGGEVIITSPDAQNDNTRRALPSASFPRIALPH